MPALDPVLWTKGTLLTPQHLQAQDRYLDEVLRFQLAAPAAGGPCGAAPLAPGPTASGGAACAPAPPGTFGVAGRETGTAR